MATYKKTTKEYSQKYGVGTRTIERWKEKGWPLDNPSKIKQLRAEQKHSPDTSAANPLPEGEVSKAEAERRKKVADAKTTEFKLAVMQGEYELKSASIAAGVVIATLVNEHLSRMEGEGPAILQGRDAIEIRRILRKRNDELRESITKEVERINAKPPIGIVREDDQAEAEATAAQVGGRGRADHNAQPGDNEVV